MKTTPLLLLTLLFNTAGYAITNEYRGGCDLPRVKLHNNDTYTEIRALDTIFIKPADTLLFSASILCFTTTPPLYWKKDSALYSAKYINNFKPITSEGFYEVLGLGEETGLGFFVKYDIALEVDEAIETTKNFLNIYPNPSTDNFHLSSSVKLKAFAVYGIDGRKVMSELLDGSKEKDIPLSHLLPGTYFLKVETEDNQSETKRLILQN